MNEKDTKRTSKFLSLVLRHEPQKIGIRLDEAGWVDVDVLLDAIARNGRPISRETLDFVVRTNDKKRFSFSEDGRRIRASQGHSVDVHLGHPSADPPEVLLHGTPTRFLDAIRREGAGEILGKKAYPGVTNIKKKIDLAVITSPRKTTLNILQDCVTANIKAAIVVNQGFNDADQRGKQMQQQIEDMAAKEGIRILGPNTLGVINSFAGFTTSFMPVMNQRVGVGLICQSGIHFVGPTKFSGMIGKGVDLGNACDIGFYDALKYYAEDPDIEVIAIHMEGLNQGKAFLSLAAGVVKEKPIVVHKSGSSETGAKAAMSHTGSLAGNYQLLRAALKQTGVTFLEEGGQMPHAVKTLLNLPPMKGNRIAVITYSGGAGIMISDGLEKHGFQLAALSSRVIDQVAALSPGWMPLSNPLDIWPAVMVHGASKAYSAALEAVLKDPGVDGIICVAIAPLPEFSFLNVSEALNEVVEASHAEKPVIGWIYGPSTTEVQKQFESKNRIMIYPTLELATQALSWLRDRYKIITRDDRDLI